MKGWIIISTYDSGYNYSISIDGKIADKFNIVDWYMPRNDIPDHKQIAKILDDGRFYPDIRIIKKIIERYSRNIIVCADGNIEIYKGCADGRIIKYEATK